jgi:eukaryotic-like serine/threonine-protein kinase
MMVSPSSAVDSRVGPYCLGERLGAGGMAEVYIAYGNDQSGRRFAIKRILPQLARDTRFVAMFCDEARICAALDHPNIVKVVDFGEHDGELFMAMEYVDGTSCARLLRTVAARGKRVPLEVAVYVARQVLSALTYAHEATDDRGRALGIVHRDVSPGNILVSRLGEVKLSDFGIVRSEFIARRTYPGELKGKIGYMSPEQVVGADVDARSDLFALGIVLAELLLTRPLFPGRSEMEILTRIYEADLRVLDHHADELPSKMVDILRFVLSRRTQDRPASARALTERIDAFCSEMGLVADGGSMVEWLVNNDLLPSQSGPREPTPSPEGEGRLMVAGGHATSDRQDVASDSPPGRSSVRAACPTFEVRLPNKEIIGPFGSAELVERFATRRLPLDAHIRRNDGRFRPARSVPELSSVLAVETWLDGVLGARDAIRAELDRTRLPNYLYGLVQRHKSGALVLVEGVRRLVTVWESGQPVGAISSDRDLLLGARLVSEGLITEAQLNESLEQRVSPESTGRPLGGRLGEVIMQRRLVSPADLLRVLVNQLEARIVGLGSWESGEIWFVESACEFSERLCTSATGLSLISSGVRSGFSGKELARILGSLGDSPLAANPVAPFPSDALGLTVSEQTALSIAPGARSMGRFLTQAVSEHGLRGDDVLRAVFIGLSAGSLVSPGWPWR